LERQEGLRAVSFLPIQNNGQLVAVCNVASHLLDEISIHARDALETVASLMGGLLQHLRAQEALRESERVQRLALQIGKIGTFEFNYVTNSAIWSPEIANIWGFPGNFNEDFSTFCWDHVHPDDLAVVKAHFSKLLQRQGENEIEFRILRPDGTVRWIRWRGQIILDAAGQATRLIGVNLDISEYKQMADDLRQMNAKLEQRVAERTKELIDEISERKQAEERLRESEQRYRDLIETLPDWVWEVNEDGVYIFSSPQARQLLGYEPDEILGRTPFDLMPPAEALRVKQLVMPLMARGDPFFFLENTVQRKDGRLLTLETSGVPIWDVHGKLRGYRGLDRDISERQRVAAELQRAKETADAASLAKSRFLTNMSHEIRTPLNAILGFAQLMQRNPDISPKQQQQLGIINRSGEHLLRLINDILDMSKIEAGRMQLTLVACDLRSLLEEMTAMFRLHTAEKGLYFEFDQVEDLPTCLYTDAGKIRQVIVNILGNAVRFTNQGGIRIAVTATPIAAKSDSQTDSRFCITITDTGVGIEPDEIGRVFEPFEQTQSGQQQGGGTGLGMSISRQLARMMGGDLTVSSQVGLGSKFCFSFVASVINATHWSTAIKSPTQSLPGFIPDLPPPTVLVLDNIELSADLRAEIIQATEAGDIARLQELIDQDVSGQYPAVGQILRQLLASYNYESILRALRGK
jgi:PAS domain S-box-containing protein